MALFTPEELEELRRADAELDEEFVQTLEEINASRKRDKESKLDRLDNKSKKIAENKRAYYEANREKWNAYLRAYRKRKKAEAAAKGVACYAQNPTVCG